MGSVQCQIVSFWRLCLLSEAAIVPQLNSPSINCILILLNLSLLGWFTLHYLYFLLLFESLSISGFQHETRMPLIWPTCLVFWWWEVGQWKQIPLGYVGVLVVDEPHWACHWQMWHVLSVSILLSFPVATWWHCPKWVLCFMHFPGLRQSGTQVLGKGTDHDWLCALCSPQLQNLRWLCGRQQATVPVGPCILRHSLVSVIQFPSCARGYSLRCAMCFLRVADPRLLWSWPMLTVHELRNSSLATVNQLRAW